MKGVPLASVLTLAGFYGMPAEAQDSRQNRQCGETSAPASSRQQYRQSYNAQRDVHPENPAIISDRTLHHQESTKQRCTHQRSNFRTAPPLPAQCDDSRETENHVQQYVDDVENGR